MMDNTVQDAAGKTDSSDSSEEVADPVVTPPDVEPGHPDGTDGSDAEADPSNESETARDDDAAGSQSTLPRLEIGDGETIDAENVVEAILFATDSPLPAARIAQIMGVGDARTVRNHIRALNELYERGGAAFRIQEIAGGYQMLTLPKFNPWLAKLLSARQQSRLSPAALETLAIVAYKQPVLRVEIEAIRGVAVGEVLNRLREMNLIKIVGRDEQLGRPMLYGTTKRFLEVFGLASLKDLPKVEELKPPE